MPITHAKVSAKSDGSDTAQVQPSDWNDYHTPPTLAEVLVAGNDPGATTIGIATANLAFDAVSHSITAQTTGSGSSSASLGLSNDVASLSAVGLVGGRSRVTLTDGYVDVTTFEMDGVTPTTGKLTYAGVPIGTQAAHVADGSTVDQLRDALIAAGLMAAS